MIAKIHSYQVPAGFLYLGMNENINGLTDFYDNVPGQPCLYQAKVHSGTKLSEHINPTQHKSGEIPKLQRPNFK